MAALTRYKILISFALVLGIGMTCLSAYIRLSDSGHDCEPWPACYGDEIVLDASPGIAISREDTNRELRVMHRGMASLFGLMVVFLAALSVWFRNNDNFPIVLPAVCLLLTVVLALVGMNAPDVLHPRVTLYNLTGGMVLNGCLLMCLLTTGKQLPAISVPRALLVCFIMTGVIMMISSGAWVSANFAAAGCESFLQCPSSGDSSLIQAFSLDRELSLIGGGIHFTAEQSIILFAHHCLVVVIFLLVALTGYIHYRTCGLGMFSLAAVILVVLIAFIRVNSDTSGLLPASLHNVSGMLLVFAVIKQLHDIVQSGVEVADD